MTVRAIFAALRARFPRKPSREEVFAEYMHRTTQLCARNLIELAQSQLAAQERISAAIIEALKPVQPPVELTPEWDRSIDALPEVVQEAIRERGSRDAQLREELIGYAFDNLGSDHGNAEDVAKRILRGANLYALLR